MKTKDPVCGMEIETSAAFATRTHQEHLFHFCSQKCVDEFDADPHRYASRALAGPEPEPSGSATTGVNPALQIAKIDLPIQGLKEKGDASTRTATERLHAVPGVRSAVVNREAGVAEIEYDPQITSTTALIRALEDAGFRAGSAQPGSGFKTCAAPRALVSSRTSLRKLLVCSARA